MQGQVGRPAPTKSIVMATLKILCKSNSPDKQIIEGLRCSQTAGLVLYYLFFPVCGMLCVRSMNNTSAGRKYFFTRQITQKACLRKLSKVGSIPCPNFDIFVSIFRQSFVMLNTASFEDCHHS